MSDKKTVTASGNIGFAGALTILFIALKLTHVIDWPWLWVLSPIWISIGLLFVLVVVGFIVAAGITILSSKKATKYPARKR